MVTLSITKTYLDGSILTEAMLDNIKNDVESWANGNIDSDNINFWGSIKFRQGGNDSLDFNDSTDTMSFKVDGTTILDFIEAAASITITAKVQDADMVFTVNDGGVDTTAITVTGSTANVTVAKNLTVSQALTVTTTSTLTGEVTIKDDLEILAPFNYKASAAGSDTYAITYDTAPSAYETGQVFLFKADVANTGAATLNVNALGAKTIKKIANGTSSDLSDNDIIANQLVLVGYDGTNMQLLGGSATMPAYKEEIFDSSGTWTKPSTVSSVHVICIGGGGGGGGNGGGSTGGPGGGSAGFITATVAVTGNITVTVGAGGAGGVGTGNGAAGGNTTFGSDVTAGGGGGGIGNDGAVGAAGTTSSSGNATVIDSSNGTAGSTRSGAAGGAGGNSPTILKIISIGGTGGAGGTGSGDDGDAGTGFGSGGGGAGGGNNGGAGASGFCIVRWVQ